MEKKSRERGAAAVEFALVLPVLLLLLVGIIEFSRVYNAQILVTNAAREAARVMAVRNDPAAATSAATTLTAPYPVAVVVGPCSAGAEVRATVTGQVDLLTGSWLGISNPVQVTGTGAMRCEG